MPRFSLPDPVRYFAPLVFMSGTFPLSPNPNLGPRILLTRWTDWSRMLRTECFLNATLFSPSDCDFRDACR